MKTTRPFHFKQFSIKQSQSAMKVTLDACLFGALVAEQSHQENIHRALDIGAGTGLLSLMLAQALPIQIDAVEIDPEAYQEAEANNLNSPFSNRVHLCNKAIEHFSPNHAYDLIICNPPFFTAGLKGPDRQRNQARHNDSLTFESLCRSIEKLLSTEGKAWLLLPTEEMERFEKMAQTFGLTVTQSWLMRSQAHQQPYRSISCFARCSDEAITNTRKDHQLIIREASNSYTESFKGLLAPYYLKL